jgi:hypothetical protein
MPDPIDEPIAIIVISNRERLRFRDDMSRKKRNLGY